MPAAIVLPVSGPYLGLWNAYPLGVQNDDGFELACTLQGQEVNATDQYGQTLVEAIYRGFNWICRLRGLEWNKNGLLAVIQMFSQPALGTLAPNLTVVGDRWSKYCQALLLTAILGNPPTYPQTITALSAGFSPNSQTAFNLTSKVREMPIEMILLPYSAVVASVTVIVPFTTS
jgi:hypothetical protein